MAGTVVDVNQYEGYTTNYEGGNKYTIKEGETTFTIAWTKKAVNATAKVSMPGTANLFVSKLSSANSMTLTVNVEDNNETKLVDAAGITWSLKNDTYDASKILTDESNRMLYTDSNCTKVAVVADLVEKV